MKSKLVAGFAGSVVVAGVLAFAGLAAAETVQISGTHSRAEIKGKCKEAGGTYSEGTKSYGCYVDSKDTSVQCNNQGTCTGQVPGKPAPAPGQRAPAPRAPIDDPAIILQ